MKTKKFMLLTNSIQNKKIDSDIREQFLLLKNNKILDNNILTNSDFFISSIERIRTKYSKEENVDEDIEYLENMLVYVTESKGPYFETFIRYLIGTFLYIGCTQRLYLTLSKIFRNKKYFDEAYNILLECVGVLCHYYSISNNRSDFRRFLYLKENMHMVNLNSIMNDISMNNNHHLYELSTIYNKIHTNFFENDLDENYIILSNEYVLQVNRLISNISIDDYSILLWLNRYIIDKCLISNIYYCSKTKSKNEGKYDRDILLKLLKISNNWKLLKIKKIFITKNNIDEEINNIFTYIDAIEYIETIKNNLIEKNVEKQFAYYTSIDSLKYILHQNSIEIEENDELNFNFMHYSYMNDPKEGKALLDFLGYQNSGINEKIPYVFMKCFTSRVDEIPMWEMYGDHAEGCCLILDLSRLTNLEKRRLYRVCYLNKNGSVCTDNCDDKLKSSNEIIERNLNKIKELFNRTNNSAAFIELLSEIRFLFKNSEYMYENETRIIYSKTEDSDFNIINNDFPKIYLKQNINININKIILGPKCVNANQIMPYIQYRLDKYIKASKSNNITEIVKSEVNYQ